MGRGEFYGTNEYNPIEEYKHFPAETYKKLREDNECGPEEAMLGKETTSLQPKEKKAKRGGGAKTLIDKLFRSVRGVATAATVAAASVVAVTTLVTSAPQAELVSYECGDTYIEYEMQVSGLEEDGEYAIVLSTTNEEDRAVVLEDDGVYHDRIEGLRPEWEYTLSLVQYDSILGEVRHFKTKLQTSRHSKPRPSVIVTGAEVVGVNKVRLSFTHSDLPGEGTVELGVTLDGASTDKILLTPADIERGYVELAVESAASLTVTPTIVAVENGNEVKTVCEGYTHVFEETFSVEAMVGLYDSSITFYPIGIANGAEYISITSSLAPGTPQLMWLDDIVKIWYSTADVITYTMHLSNDVGDVLSNVITLTVDTTVSTPSVVYHMETRNPGDVSITYNDDGTINMYIPTHFESQNESVYYQITVGDIRYTSREPLARIEHIPDQSYALSYDVCVDINGMPYSIFSVSPSGMANESYYYFERILEDKSLSLKLYKDDAYLDMNSVKLVSDRGEEIVLSETDFVYNALSDSYEVIVTFNEYPDEVVISMMVNPYYNELGNIDDYAGHIGKLFEVTVYQP